MDHTEKIIYGVFVTLVVVFVGLVVYNSRTITVEEEPVLDDVEVVEDGLPSTPEIELDSVLQVLQQHEQRIEELENHLNILRNKVLKLDQDLWNSVK
mgnify:FL=1|jgi:hypothetical protein